MDDLKTHLSLRRAQLVDLRAMLADGHTGAAAGIERIEAELAILDPPPKAPPAAATDTTAPAAAEG